VLAERTIDYEQESHGAGKIPNAKGPNPKKQRRAAGAQDSFGILGFGVWDFTKVLD
jgi:hypothetical protein